jgi:hypothetical protein
VFSPYVATTRKSIFLKTTYSSRDSAHNCRTRASAVSMSFTASTQRNGPLPSFFKIYKSVFIIFLSLLAARTSPIDSREGVGPRIASKVRKAAASLPSACGKHGGYPGQEQSGVPLTQAVVLRPFLRFFVPTLPVLPQVDQKTSNSNSLSRGAPVGGFLLTSFRCGNNPDRIQLSFIPQKTKPLLYAVVGRMLCFSSRYPA